MTIMHLINNADKLEAGEDVPKFGLEEMKFMEFLHFDNEFGVDKAAKVPPPRTMKTHLPLRFYKKQLEANPATKVIQITRNPKDTLVSFFHFARMNKGLGQFQGTFSDYFGLFERDELPYGDLFMQTSEWYKYLQNRENSLTLIYEEMKKDLKGNVVKICKFLGKEVSEKVVDMIVAKTTFENMSKDAALNQSDPNNTHLDQTKSKFLRKGKIGDWVEYFSEEQSEIIREKCKKFFDPIGLTFEYQ